jgi:hypothetical protein
MFFEQVGEFPKPHDHTCNISPDASRSMVISALDIPAPALEIPFRVKFDRQVVKGLALRSHGIPAFDSLVSLRTLRVPVGSVVIPEFRVPDPVLTERGAELASDV